MAFITWDDRYSVDPAMDPQHKKFFEILNRLHDAMLSGAGREIHNRTLLELAAYTRTHFRSEEALLGRRGYPELVAHKQMHEGFIAQVRELESKIAAGQHVLTVDLLQFVKTWLSDHILGADAKYGAWLKAH